MRSSIAALAFAIAFAPAAAPAAAGEHDYDWLVGTWTCINSMPSPIGGPAKQAMTVAPSYAQGFFVRITGHDFERSGYIGYAAKTHRWWNPFSYPNGNHAVESTTQRGAKTTWEGPYVDVGTGTTFEVRDIYTVSSPTRFTEVGQYRSGDAWHTGFSGTCTKS